MWFDLTAYILKMIAKDAIEPDCNLKIALSNHMSLKNTVASCIFLIANLF